MWLFLAAPTSRCTPEHLVALIHKLEVPTVAGRGAAIRQHILDPPAPIVADALGYHHNHDDQTRRPGSATWRRYSPGDHSQSDPETGDS